MSGCNAPQAFSFLSGRQILALERLTSRQALSVQPRIRRPPPLDPQENESENGGDDALLYVFVSHRWDEEGDPDTEGLQLRALKHLMRLVEELVLRKAVRGISPRDSGQEEDESSAKTLSWPRRLEDLSEGMPQAASLVSRIFQRRQKVTQGVAGKDNDKDGATFHEMLQNPLDHVWLWYDCSCLPQKFPLPRTPAEKLEMNWALSNLDWLVRRCELLCLRKPNDSYESRAWCSLEQLEKSLQDFDGSIALDCVALQDGATLDWFAEEDGPNPGQNHTSKLRHLQGLLTTPNPSSGPILAESLLQRVQAALNLGSSFETQSQRASEALRRSRGVAFTNLRRQWEDHLLNPHGNTATNQVPLSSPPPDLVRLRNEIRRSRLVAPEDPPLQRALEQAARELFAAIFVTSCRDAAAWANVRDIPAERNACVSNVGIECGLHAHTLEGESVADVEDKCEAKQTDRFLEGIDSCYEKLEFQKKDDITGRHGREVVLCSNGHRLVPKVATLPLGCNSTQCRHGKVVGVGHVHTSCVPCNFDMCYNCTVGSTGSNVNPDSQEALENALRVCGVRFPLPGKLAPAEELCERRVTIDLYELTKTLLTQYEQECTNGDDQAFVGLLALRNFLFDRPGQVGKLHLNAGALRFLRPMVEEAVRRLSTEMLTDRKSNTPLRLMVTVVLHVPRWVLLDMANSMTCVNVSLLHKDPLTFGLKAHRYLEERPEAISFSFHPKDVLAIPLRLSYCQRDKSCNNIWYPCQHEIEKHTALVTFARGDDSLDSWTTFKLPTSLALFGCDILNDHVFITGGVTGEEDPNLKVFATCLSEARVASLLDQNRLEWRSIPSMIEPRCSHASCVVRDEDGSPILIVSGGAQPPNKLSSVEMISIHNPQRGWIEGPSLPHPRKSHHMVGLGGCVLVFGGSTDMPSKYDRDSLLLLVSNGSWQEGPKLPTAFRGGDAILLRERFIAVFGGMSGYSQSRLSWVLDAKPWVEWCISGGSPGQRPTSNWMNGPVLPVPMASPNICFAPASWTGRQDDWILSTGSIETRNVCLGICIDLSEVSDDPAYWASLRWQRLGAVPDVTAMGRTFVAEGSLYMIGGFRDIDQKLTATVHARRLNLSHQLPVPTSPSVARTPIFGEILDHYRIALNNHFLVGRLGFPLPEKHLYSDGDRVLRLLPPTVTTSGSTIAVRHCQLCLWRSQSIESARVERHAALYHLKSARWLRERGIVLCADCLCQVSY